MKVAIVGSRDYPNMRAVREYVASLPRDTVIVSGGARGVDSVAVEEAKRLGMPTEVHPADWNTHGKAAGFIRNADIVAAADEVVAFWDGESRGTKHTIDLAKKAGKSVGIVAAEKVT